MFSRSTLPVALGFILLSGSASPAASSNYTLVQEYPGKSFFDGWDWFVTSESNPDPTGGFVNYVDKRTAVDQNYTGYIFNAATNETTAYIGVDYTNVAPNGRDSIRISTNQTWSNGALWTADIRHMPMGICGTWPAYWLLGTGAAWPDNGEVDVIEGVNDAQYNSMTLHTTPGCSVNNASSSMLGTLQHTNCDALISGNSGCGVTASMGESSSGANRQTVQHATAGPAFNSQGGGVYATLWTDEGISVYMFPQSAVPSDVAMGRPDPSSWTIPPLAHFAGSSCDFQTKFNEMQIILNTDFCGAWAGAPNVWGQSPCSKQASSCDAFVQNNPSAFKEAYWNIASIKVYQTFAASTQAKRSESEGGIVDSAKFALGHIHGKFSHAHLHGSHRANGSPLTSGATNNDNGDVVAWSLAAVIFFLAVWLL